MNIMKNGKLFGALNLLDIIIIAVILTLILPMIHYYIKFNERGLAEEVVLNRFIKQETRQGIGVQTGPSVGTLDVDVSFKGLTKDMLNKIKVHDKEALKNGTVLAEILWIGKPIPNYFIVNLGGEQNRVLRKTIVGKDLYSLPVKMRIYGVIGDFGKFSHKAKPVSQFGRYIFTTEEYESDFVVEALSPTEIPHE